jgi:hypothetical protein
MFPIPVLLETENASYSMMNTAKQTARPLEKISAAKRYLIKSHFFSTEANDNLNSFLYLAICIKETKILEHGKKWHMASKQSTIATETASLKS